MRENRDLYSRVDQKRSRNNDITKQWIAASFEFPRARRRLFRARVPIQTRISAVTGIHREFLALGIESHGGVNFNIISRGREEAEEKLFSREWTRILANILRGTYGFNTPRRILISRRILSPLAFAVCFVSWYSQMRSRRQ